MPDTEIFQPFTEKVSSASFRSLTDIPTTDRKSGTTNDFHLELKVRGLVRIYGSMCGRGGMCWRGGELIKVSIFL
jgi:hypothetical protein